MFAFIWHLCKNVIFFFNLICCNFVHCMFYSITSLPIFVIQIVLSSFCLYSIVLIFVSFFFAFNCLTILLSAFNCLSNCKNFFEICYLHCHLLPSLRALSKDFSIWSDINMNSFIRKHYSIHLDDQASF